MKKNNHTAWFHVSLQLGVAVALTTFAFSVYALTTAASQPNPAANLLTTTPTAAKPSRTPAVTPSSSCTEAAKVTLTNAGQTLCVSGTVAQVNADQTANYLKFKNAQFQIISYSLNRDFAILKGRCIKVTGAILKLSGRPTLNLGNKIAITDCNDKPISIPTKPTVKNTASPTPTATTRTTPQATFTPTPAGDSGLPAAPTGTKGKITVANQTEHDITLIMWGPSNQTFGAAAFQTNTFEIPAGDYGWTAAYNGCKLVPVGNLPVRSAYTIIISVVPGDGCGGELSVDVQ